MPPMTLFAQVLTGANHQKAFGSRASCGTFRDAKLMITILRKHSRWLMIVIAILAMPFCLYFVRTDWMSALRSNTAAKLYGRDISTTEIEGGARLFQLASNLGMNEFINELLAQWRPQRAKTQSEAQREAEEEFAIDLMILQHEAEALGIRPTTAEIASVVTKMRAFRGDAGSFDIKRYNDIVQNALGPLGFTEAQIEELAGDQIRLDRVKELLSTGVTVSPAESKTNFEQLYSKFEVSVVRFKTSDVANEVKISDDEIAKYYEGAKEQLKSEEKRKVQFVALTLSEAEKKLTGKERIDALQKFSDKANDVAQALAEKNADFAAVAVKFQLSIKNTGDFTQAAPDPELKQDSQLVQAAFQLSNDEPTSEPIQGADGFYILHLAGITPARPLTLAEAKPKIVEALKARKERELLATRAANVAHDLGEALKAGDTLAKADEIFDDANGDLATGELESAVEKYRRCVEIDPEFFDGWHALGMALMKIGRFPEAIEAGKRATELRPNDQIAWTSLSLFYNRNGDIKEAEAAGTKAKILGWGGKVAKGDQ